ncbi:formate dehydrogenase [Anaerobacillus alkalilacustris]|uniref:Formate dehydrogenase n=1 Tax=Anaerobacillus alkalilacustris TaxID=393763 RepID=A0A1S2LQS9_9BACI|nr:formate dehydrogenase [Anaerobacillus alkalilacustris]
MGSNTTDAHPVVANRIKKAVKQGVRLIVIDPRKIDMTKPAEKHLQLKVGSDIALLNAMMHVIINEELYDKEYIQRVSEGFDELKEKVQSYTPEYAEDITGVPADDIREVARMYATADRGMIAYTLGITEHHFGVNNVFAIANFALLTGNIGKEGTGIMPLRGQNNVQGAGDMGCLPNQLTGGSKLINDGERKLFEDAWDVKISPQVGHTQTTMFEKMTEGKMKALYIIGENPIMVDANMNHTRKAIENVDLVIVQDIFLHETAKIADVVLPARSWAEVDGTYTNADRRVQRTRQGIEAHPNTKDDWQILCELAAMMGYEMSYDSSEQIWNEVRTLAPDVFGGMTYERFDNEGGLHYPCPSVDHPGTLLLHERFHQGVELEEKSRFVPVDFSLPAEPTDEEYPLTLITGRRYEQYNTNSQSRYYPPNIKLKQTEETVDMNENDAANLNIEDGEYVEVASRRGKVKVKVKVCKKMKQGDVFMSFHWMEVPTNILTIDEYDPISGTAEFKACAVKISKIS